MMFTLQHLDRPLGATSKAHLRVDHHMEDRLMVVLMVILPMLLTMGI